MQGNSPQKSLLRILSSDKTVPFLILGVLLLTYGVYLTSWGLYYDDWPTFYIFFSHRSILEYYQFDRPFAAWTDLLFSTILGTDPLAWQITCLLMRWLTVTALWWCFRLIWPKAKQLVLSIALIFSIYPIFSLQPIAVTFTKVFFWYALYFFSIGFMILTVQKHRRWFLFTTLALLTGAIHIFSVEYFWGLELLRPLFLWPVISKNPIPLKKQLTKILLYWFPYITLLGGMIVWRVFLANFATDADYFQHDPNNIISILENIFNSPKKYIIDLLKLVFRDTSFILVDIWGHATRLNAANINTKTLLGFLGISLLAAIFVFFLFYLHLQRRKSKSSSRSCSRKTNHSFWFFHFFYKHAPTLDHRTSGVSTGAF